MAAALNSNWWQVVTYCLVAALAVGAAIWERHLLRTGDRRDLWPLFHLAHRCFAHVDASVA